MSTRLLVTLGTVAFIGLVLVVGCNVFIREGPEPVYVAASAARLCDGADGPAAADRRGGAGAATRFHLDRRILALG